MTVIASTRIVGNRAGIGPRVRAAFWVSAPAVVVTGLLKLALSDGGRDPETLALVQTVFLAVLAVLVWVGRSRIGSLALAIGTMIAAVGVSTITSVRLESSVRELVLWLTYLSIAVIVSSTLHSHAAVRRFTDAVTVLAGWLVLVALFIHWGAGQPGVRWSSTFYYPNAFAAFLLLVWPLTLTRCVHASTGRDALAHGVVAVLLTIALALTYSRGAWLTTLLVVPLAIVLWRPPGWITAVRRLVLIAMGTAAAVLLLTQSPAALSARVRSVPDASDYSLQAREQFWASALAIFRHHPLIGTGAGTFGAVHARYQRDPRFYSREAHSIYLQTAAELGVVGATALLIVLATVAVVWARALRRAEGETRALVAGVGIGLAAFFIHSGIDMDWAFPANPAMAFALVGALAWQEPSLSTAGSSKGWRLLAPLLLLAAALIQVWQVAQRHYDAGAELARRGSWRAASDHYAVAVRWNPLSARYLAAYASAVQTLTPGSDLPRTLIMRARAVDPWNAAHPLQLARLMLASGPNSDARKQRVEALLRDAIALDPVNRPEAHLLLAQVYLDAGDTARAERVYADAARIYSGRNLQSGLYALALWPGVAHLQVQWAQLLLAQRRYAEAETVLRSVLTADPGWEPAYLPFAAVYRRQGRWGDADRVLRQGLATIPDSERIWVEWRSSHRSRVQAFER